ncbi:MAG: bifunctional diaminohydroxyphosphoribosylaminopyrimidine deaminase/5-amino-6-(5-phosphoribosylamino)uracil reductase RibD [Pseudomonadota bacterium]
MTTANDDTRWMAHALTLGRRGQGRVWPNPAVGCVIVKQGRVLGRGWTQPGGRPHAETMALAQAGPDAAGATAYVTLEPCAHHGKTPPCATALVQAGIARCVVATGDPDPRVSGKGIDILHRHGISVSQGVLKDRADYEHRGFFYRLQRHRPRVTVKLALSLDGRIATASGESQWITGPQARRMVHADRLAHDAVMVGGGTARADDPTLTVRGLGAGHQPLRIVTSRHLDFPGTALQATLDRAPLWILHGTDAPETAKAPWNKAHVTLIETPTEGRLLNMTAGLGALADKGLTSIYVEGGGSLVASLLAAHLVDDVIVYHAGLAIGAEGRPGLGGLEQYILAHCPRFTLQSIQQVGRDIRQHWVP